MEDGKGRTPTRGVATEEKIRLSENSSQRKKLPKRDQLTPDQMEKALHAKKSYWPFALSFAMLISMVGVVTHPIVLGVGVALAIVAIIGWGLEYH